MNLEMLTELAEHVQIQEGLLDAVIILEKCHTV